MLGHAGRYEPCYIVKGSSVRAGRQEAHLNSRLKRIHCQETNTEPGIVCVGNQYCCSVLVCERLSDQL